MSEEGPDRPDNMREPDVVEVGSPDARGAWWPVWLLLAVIGVFVVGILAFTSFDDAPSDSSSPASPSPSPSPSPTSPSTELTSPSGGSGPDQNSGTRPPAITNVAPEVLGVTAPWELFALGSDELVRIELANGRVTRTSIPPIRSGAGAALVVGPDRALIQPSDSVIGYVVPDGRRARGLPDVLNHNGRAAVPGPEPGQVWVSTGNNDGAPARWSW